jgi:hypothetical protein
MTLLAEINSFLLALAAIAVSIAIFETQMIRALDKGMMLKTILLNKKK